MKWNYIFGFITAALLGVIFYLIYGVGNEMNAERERLRQEIDSIEWVLKNRTDEISIILENYAEKGRVADSLEKRLKDYREDLVRKRKKISEYEKVFQEMSDSDRDSVLREYIRANQ